MDILKTLETEFNIKSFQAENTVKLIDEGNTIPFIARYRKELTGSLDDQLLRQIYDRLMYLRGMEEKKAQIIKSIDEQGKLTDEIVKALEKAKTVTELDDIYRPFRPKRRTKASIAKEKGLEGLCEIIMGQKMQGTIEENALAYVN
ncbi:MAG: RNA-binding transcriptional accessory protein, partial [Firmicutes bacterium]|nr:RNA-binding transcriptional accessory protein [Bacillota bacterium]